jgi:hypothetical protein
MHVTGYNAFWLSSPYLLPRIWHAYASVSSRSQEQQGSLFLVRIFCEPNRLILKVKITPQSRHWKTFSENVYPAHTTWPYLTLDWWHIRVIWNESIVIDIIRVSDNGATLHIVDRQLVMSWFRLLEAQTQYHIRDILLCMIIQTHQVLSSHYESRDYLVGYSSNLSSCSRHLYDTRYIHMAHTGAE